MVNAMVGSGSQELIATFGPIISNEALWHLWTNHGTDWFIIPPYQYLQPTGSWEPGQLSTNHFIGDLRASESLVTLIG
jgi:hypothetical protein